MDAKTAMTRDFRVEILHPESDTWTHIHGTRWETSTEHTQVMRYALQVSQDYPESKVRIVEVTVIRDIQLVL